MSPDDVRAVLGHAFAGRVNRDEWLTGRLVAYTDEPTVVIEVASGLRDGIPVQRHIVLSTIRDWASDADGAA